MNVNSFGDIPDKRLEEIRIATLCDASLQAVMKLVLEGCQKTSVILHCVSPFFDVRDSLSVIDRVLVKGEAVVIPSMLRVNLSREDSTLSI